MTSRYRIFYRNLRLYYAFENTRVAYLLDRTYVITLKKMFIFQSVSFMIDKRGGIKMVKIVRNIGFSLVVVILLAGCTGDTKNDKEAQEKESNTKVSLNEANVSNTIDTTNMSNNEKKESTTSDTSNVITSEVDQYNELPLEVKIQLIATLVDDRAKPIGNDGLNERGFYIYYRAYDDYVLTNVHSGVGTGHPIYLINYDSNNVTPVEGVVTVGANNNEIVDNINTNPISKASLYEKYLLNKVAFDNSVSRVQAQDFISIENFNLKKQQAEQRSHSDH